MKRWKNMCKLNFYQNKCVSDIVDFEAKTVKQKVWYINGFILKENRKSEDISNLIITKILYIIIGFSIIL